jgi:hypothetical protein
MTVHARLVASVADINLQGVEPAAADGGERDFFQQSQSIVHARNVTEPEQAVTPAVKHINVNWPAAMMRFRHPSRRADAVMRRLDLRAGASRFLVSGIQALAFVCNTALQLAVL